MQVSSYVLGLDGGATHVTALGLYYVLTMMGYCVLGFQGPPGGGRLILRRWRE